VISVGNFVLRCVLNADVVRKIAFDNNDNEKSTTYSTWIDCSCVTLQDTTAPLQLYPGGSNSSF